MNECGEGRENFAQATLYVPVILTESGVFKAVVGKVTVIKLLRSVTSYFFK